jgi:hypothetical protein
VPGLTVRFEYNPGGVVYGVLAVATVIAAESTRRETFGKLILASVVTMALYWLAHGYSHHWGARLDQPGAWTFKEIAVSLGHELPILVGAIVPILVLVVAWAVGAGTETAVTAVLWTAGAELLLLEVVPGIRHHLKLRALALETLFGVSMGAGIYVLRLVLH